jgi:hypothetical protein
MADYDDALLEASSLDTNLQKRIPETGFGSRGLYIAAPANRNPKNLN